MRQSDDKQVSRCVFPIAFQVMKYCSKIKHLPSTRFWIPLNLWWWQNINTLVNLCTFPSAPANLLTAIGHLRALRDMPEADDMPGTAAMATVALLKREAHLHMLSAELVVLHLFNSKASEDSRARMARALLGYLSLWTPGEILIDPVSRSFPLFSCLLPYSHLLRCILTVYSCPINLPYTACILNLCPTG